VRGSLSAPPHGRSLRVRREAPDIGIAEADRAVLDRIRCLCLCRTFLQVRPPLVDRWADGCVAGVVPHRNAVVIRRIRVDVVAQELADERVRTRSAWITDWASVKRRPPGRATVIEGSPAGDTYETAGGERRLPERCREGVVDDIEAAPIGLEGRRRVVATIATRRDLLRITPVERSAAGARSDSVWMLIRRGPGQIDLLLVQRRSGDVVINNRVRGISTAR
jgi:hypothetical protein